MRRGSRRTHGTHGHVMPLLLPLPAVSPRTPATRPRLAATTGGAPCKPAREGGAAAVLRQAGAGVSDRAAGPGCGGRGGTMRHGPAAGTIAAMAARRIKAALCFGPSRAPSLPTAHDMATSPLFSGKKTSSWTNPTNLTLASVSTESDCTNHAHREAPGLGLDGAAVTGGRGRRQRQHGTHGIWPGACGRRGRCAACPSRPCGTAPQACCAL